MATPEGKIKSKLDKMFKSEGVLYYSPQAGPYGASGWPDRIAIVCGLFLGVECKADAKCKPTALQLRIGEQIKNAGAEWFLVYDDATIEQVRQWIDSTRRRGQKDTGGSVREPASDPRCYTDGPWCEGPLSVGTSYFGHGPGLTEPGVQHPLPNPPLL